jgi:hypothetical protein
MRVTVPDQQTDPVTHKGAFHRGPVLTPGRDTTKSEALHGDAQRLRAKLHERPEFRELIRGLAERRPAIAAGAFTPLPPLPDRELATARCGRQLSTPLSDALPLQVVTVDPRKELVAAAEHWRQLGKLARLLHPYTLWTEAELDWLVRRWNDETSLGAIARKRGIRSPVTIAYMLDANAPSQKARRKTEDAIDYVAHSLALIAAGSRSSVADRRAAGPYRTEEAVRLARKRWRDRLRPVAHYA